MCQVCRHAQRRCLLFTCFLCRRLGLVTGKRADGLPIAAWVLQAALKQTRSQGGGAVATLEESS